MRFIWKALLALLIVVALVIITPFTPWGNSWIKSYAQGMINEYSPLPLEVSQLNLGFSSFLVEVKGQESVLANLQGNYSILGLSLDARLKLDVKDLSYASSVAGMDLQGAFSLEAKASGGMDRLEIVGYSDIAHSKTVFLAEIKDLAFSDLNLQIEGAQVGTLLATIAKPPYAKALLDVKATVKNDQASGLDGTADVNIKNGEIDIALVKRDFGVAVPATQFDTKLIATFKGENITHDLLIKSNVGRISTQGATNISTLATDSKYLLDVRDLSPLTPLLQMPIRGDLKLDGKIKGGQKSLLVDGNSNIAGSNTHYSAQLVEFAPASVEANVRSLNLEKLLYMLYQPIYTQGVLNLNAKLHDFSGGISGQVVAEIPNGKTNNAPIKRSFDIDLPATAYSLTLTSTLNRGNGELATIFKSNLAQLDLPKVKFALAPQLTVHAPYNLLLPDLNRLQFVTGMPMKGEIKANGEVTLDKKGLSASFLSNMLGGQVVANLENNIISAKLNKLRSEELLKMLTYSPFFSSQLDGALQYEMVSNQGVLEASLQGGRLTKNAFTTIIGPLLGMDFTKEMYQQAALRSSISNQVLLTDFYLASNNTVISTKQAKIDTLKKRVDATLSVSVKNKPTNVKITGDLNKPKISVDRVNQAINETKEKIKETINQKINSTLDKGLQKHLNPEQSENIKGLLNKILKP